MSLEQAITDHAAAIRELAAANLEVAAIMSATIKGQLAQAAISNAIAEVKGTKRAEPTDAQIDAEIDANVAKVEAAAKAEKAAAAKNASSAAGTATQVADTQTTAGAVDTATAEAQTSYDYAKDVAPVLTKVAQKSRDSLVALLAKFGAKKGNEIKADDYAAVLAEANKLLAG